MKFAIEKYKTVRMAASLISCLALFCIQSVGFANVAAPRLSQPWTHWARAVGQSETERAQAIAHLEADPQLNARLLKALSTSERALALDVISALELTDMIPELLLRLPADQDGFIALTLNSLMAEGNQTQILNVYKTNLSADGSAAQPSAATLVAMFEPLGRLGVEISKIALSKAFAHSYPEVRSAALYYLRTMALTHHNHFGDLMLKDLLSAKEFQLRLQTISILNELATSPDAIDNPAPLTAKDLFALCETEPNAQIKNECLSLLRKKRVQP